jgi:hypothetical protein
MIDKLKLISSEKVKEEKLRSIFNDSNYTYSQKPDSIYGKVIVVNGKAGHVLTLKNSPIYSVPSPTQIILNPSNWSGFKSLSNRLEELLPLESLRIARIDHKLDINRPINEIYAGLRIRSKQDCNKYSEHEEFKKGRLTGFYIGKEPETYCIYDKAYQLEGKKTKLIPGQTTGVMTRIELRQTKKKVLEPNFLNLSFYIDNPPFNNLEFYEANFERNSNIELATEIQCQGFNLTYQKKNEHGNFRRDYSKYFKEINFNQEANKIYAEQLLTFMEN